MKPFLIATAAIVCCAPAVGAQDALPAAPDPAPVRTTPFPDVPREHWAFDAVEQLRKLGIVRGYPPNATFSPQAGPKTAAPARPSKRAG